MGRARKRNPTTTGIYRYRSRKRDRLTVLPIWVAYTAFLLFLIWASWQWKTDLFTVERVQDAIAAAHSYGQHQEVVNIYETPVQRRVQSDIDFYRDLDELHHQTLLLVADSYLHAEQEYEAGLIYAHVLGMSQGEYRSRCQDAGACDDLTMLQSMAHLYADDNRYSLWHVLSLSARIIGGMILYGFVLSVVVWSLGETWHHWMPIGAYRVQLKRIQEIDDLYGESNYADVVRVYESPFNVPLAPRLDWRREKGLHFMISPETLLKVANSYEQNDERETALALYLKALDWSEDQYKSFCDKVADSGDLTPLHEAAQIHLKPA